MKERNLEQKKIPMRIDLVRHGMTRGNEERRYIGITDEPLSERGRNLAEQVCMRGRRLCFPVR
ncbi:MAG: histidine phosphatase family protein [Faecalimonas umbilicata]